MSRRCCWTSPRSARLGGPPLAAAPRVLWFNIRILKAFQGFLNFGKRAICRTLRQEKVCIFFLRSWSFPCRRLNRSASEFNRQCVLQRVSFRETDPYDDPDPDLEVPDLFPTLTSPSDKVVRRSHLLNFVLDSSVHHQEDLCDTSNY